MSDYIDFIDSNGDEWTRTNRFREVKETIAAQAAVIEKLREALTACVCAMQDHQAGIGITEIFDKSEALGRKILATPTDSTQILAEVRRAERERVAQMILNGRFLHDESPAAQFAKEVAAAIRAME